MKVSPTSPPRRFKTGRKADVEISDCGTIALTPDEQVTFITPDGGEFDVARKDWGFYATPSLEARLPNHGLRPLLARNTAGRSFILLVETGRETQLEAYLAREEMRILRWLDTDPEPESTPDAL